MRRSLKRGKGLKDAVSYNELDMRGSHSPALDLLRFSTVPSVGFSRGMHCGRGSTTLTHTVCWDPPSFHNLPLQGRGVFRLRQTPKATLQACFIFSSPLQICHTDTSQAKCESNLPIEYSQFDPFTHRRKLQMGGKKTFPFSYSYT